MGDPGTANVMYSDWFVPSWNKDDLPNYKEHIVSIDVLTDDFIENGEVVLVYLKVTYLDNDVEKTSILPLPSSGEGFYGSYRLDIPNNMAITLSGLNEEDLPEQLAGAMFRYILIPGGVAREEAERLRWIIEIMML